MNKYLLIGVAAILIVGGGWWYLNQSSAPATSETAQLLTTQQNTNTGSKAPVPQPSPATSQPATTRTYTGAGFEATIPSSWKVVEKMVVGSAGGDPHMSFQSPSYTLKTAAEVDEKMGESKNWVKSGMVIEVFPQGNEVTGSWKDPAEYVRYFSGRSSSNSTSQKQISLDGQPALLTRIRGDDGSISEGVRTVRNGREVWISFRFANETSVDWAVWSKFLSSFKFR